MASIVLPPVKKKDLLYTAPVDVNTVIIPKKDFESKPFQLKLRTESALAGSKSVCLEDGIRKIPRVAKISTSNPNIKKGVSLKESVEDLARADNLRKKAQSFIDIENEALFEENLFYVEPPKEFPGPYDPERARILYARYCESRDVLPSRRFLTGLLSGRVIAGYQFFGPTGARPVAVSLMTNLTVTELLIPHNNLGPEGMLIIAKLINDNEAIKVLDISDNGLGREGAKILAAAIKENGSIQQITAAGNTFDDHTGKYFEEAFKYNTSIRQVDFSRNCFCEEGASLLAKGFEENYSVTHLDLQYNHIRRRGIRGIAKMLLVNSCMMQLDLSWNGIDIDGAMQLGQGLNKNTSLSVLNVSGCHLTAVALLKFLQKMKDNRALKSMQIKDNPLTNADLMIFIRAIETLPDIVLNFIDASTVMVSQDLVDLQKTIAKSRPGFMITYRGLLSIKDQSKNMMETMDLTGGDPLGVIISYARQKNLRLMDIFARFDTDKSGTLTRQELIMGVADAGIPLSIAQLDRLLAKLDKDGDGEIDFSELLEGHQKYLRNLHKRGKVAREVLKGEVDIFAGLMPSAQEKAHPSTAAAAAALKSLEKGGESMSSSSEIKSSGSVSDKSRRVSSVVKGRAGSIARSRAGSIARSRVGSIARSREGSIVRSRVGSIAVRREGSISGKSGLITPERVRGRAGSYSLSGSVSPADSHRSDDSAASVKVRFESLQLQKYHN